MKRGWERSSTNGQGQRESRKEKRQEEGAAQAGDVVVPGAHPVYGTLHELGPWPAGGPIPLARRLCGACLASSNPTILILVLLVFDVSAYCAPLHLDFRGSLVESDSI